MSTPDDVDQIVAAWQVQRPDLDVTPLQVLSRLTRVSAQLDTARAKAFRDHDLDSWEFDVLAALRRTGPPFTLSAGTLSTQTHVTSGTMTTRVDRLLERGFVARFPDTNDRRGVLIALTDAGQIAVDGALKDLLEREKAALSGLDRGSQEQLATLLRGLLDQF
ncbi:MAG: MarR family transcriptional regulator [Candidatus Nanopelagicales bacterium]|jgi:DNA-binding MarR family transcriptional regulator|nr:MarR family transcriptional regulator [Actinomycetes bacterium]MCH9738666.1 MarR family transcriptional regulator [Actinomycetes bacterium]MCH9831536.1 MarR family transcriptional regulator [Actinomycetes bacterium]MCH9840161.1 MarR family transcriptional regulator [Actinomycetes bacterium]